MGRLEKPLNPGDGPVQSFACDLRVLRAAAGNISYRTLSERAHYSVTALSQAAAGRDLPSLAVTLAFVQACGGNVDEWEQRWRALSTTDERDCGVPASEPPLPLPAAGPARPPRHRWRTILMMVAVAVCTAVITDVVVRPGNVRESGDVAVASQQASPGQADPVADGSDPTRAGCGPDAVTMAVTRVQFPASQLSGTIELRYSPHCHAAWARFEPAAGWHPGAGTMVTVWTIRPADQATQTYSVEFGGETIIGNILLTARGCVAAEATIARGSIQSPIATTVCMVIS